MNNSIVYQESELVMLLKQHHETAFSYLYDHYSASLYSVILSIIPDRELSNDILQEVFVKIFRQIETYDSSKGRLFTWMLNIARNASIDALRSKNYQRSQQNRELTENVYERGGSTQTNTDKIGLRKIVNKLKEEYRVLVELSYFEGFTQEEISKMLNIPLGTVKTRLRTALIQLKQVIKT
ncbi:RNA polymerase sigma factor [Segetibacter koreensis]|uniref:RNA polymerase sigma factor n=1 Tax=Segetibacter koreensis TaxID=398037 RepID=UPI0005270C86|nr:sigma-70 family RNA polymerase sigma factor [Segetibacter koreensis]